MIFSNNLSMQPFEPLIAFYDAIADDVRITTTHISLYMALLQQWNLNEGKSPIAITRDNIMRVAKISSRHTYNKCINQLQEYGYIQYMPSLSPFSYSIVYFKSL